MTMVAWTHVATCVVVALAFVAAAGYEFYVVAVAELNGAIEKGALYVVAVAAADEPVSEEDTVLGVQRFASH